MPEFKHVVRINDDLSPYVLVWILCPEPKVPERIGSEYVHDPVVRKRPCSSRAKSPGTMPYSRRKQCDVEPDRTRTREPISGGHGEGATHPSDVHQAGVYCPLLATARRASSSQSSAMRKLVIGALA